MKEIIRGILTYTRDRKDKTEERESQEQEGMEPDCFFKSEFFKDTLF